MGRRSKRERERETVAALMDAVVVILAPQWHWDTGALSGFPLAVGFLFFPFLFFSVLLCSSEWVQKGGELNEEKGKEGRERERERASELSGRTHNPFLCLFSTL